jgi:tRNA pseudouridine55 synthase
MLGQPVLLRGRDAPLMQGTVSVSTAGTLVAIAELHEGALKPKRIFNLPR